MKKLIVSVIAVVMALGCCLAIFAGCGEKSDPAHTIYFYSSQGDKLATTTELAIQAFEAKYPGWKVEHTQPGGYDEVLDKIRSDIQGGVQPDLAYCYSDHVAQYITSGKVVDMAEFFDSEESFTYSEKDENGNDKVVFTVDHLGFTEEERADIVPNYLKEGYAKGNYSDYEQYGYNDDTLFTLPFVKSTELLYYNKTVLDTLGWEVATTWDELWDQCEKIKAMPRYQKCTPLGYDSEANWFITMSEQTGWGYTSTDSSNHFLFNNDKAAEWLGQLSEYYDKGYITTQTDYGSYTSGLFTKGPEEGGLLYCIGSSGGASNQKSSTFTVGITGIPGVDEEHRQCISQGPSLVMLTGRNGVSNAEEKKIMTWLFVKELLDPDFQAEFAMASGYNPARESVYDLEVYQDFINEGDTTAMAAGVARELTDRFFTSPAFVGSSVARTQVGNALLAAMRGQNDPQTALQEAYKNCGGK